MSPAAFRKMFREALDCLHLTQFNFQLYSLRRGGATYDYLANNNIQRTVLRGRWGDLRTARIYIQDGAASITELRLSPQAQNQVALFSAYLQRYIWPS